jgi:CDP-glycerol glycerophosphotransferase (TagB/SpsB family)
MKIEIIKRLVILLSPFIYVITNFFPKDRRKICFGSWYGKEYSGSPRYIFEYAKFINKTRPIWITKSDEAKKLAESKGFEAYYAYSFKGIYHQITAKTFICNINSRDFFPPTISFFTTLINLGHGMPFKAGFGFHLPYSKKILKKIRDKTIDNYKYVAISSSFFSKVAKKQYPGAEPLIMPEARCDGLKVSNKEIELLKEKYNLQKAKFIGLYLPTHRNEGNDIESIKRNYKSILDCLDNNPNLHILVNLHFYDRKHAAHLQSHPRALVINENINISPLMSLSDFLIGDYSGAIFDYLYLNKPTIAFIPDHVDYVKNSRTLYFDFEKIYSIVCKDIHGLGNAFDLIENNSLDAIKNPQIYSEKIDIGDFSKIAYERILKVVGYDS